MQCTVQLLGLLRVTGTGTAGRLRATLVDSSIPDPRVRLHAPRTTTHTNNGEVLQLLSVTTWALFSMKSQPT